MILSDKFICAGEKYSTFSRRIPAPIFKKKISVYNEIKKAEITVCGLGFYELFLNGKNITKGKLCPYISNSDHVVFYDNHDITSSLKKVNDFEFLLGNGMQNAFGGFVWDFQKASFRSAPKLAFAIEIFYENGKTEIIEADETVQVARSSIISDDLRLGEVFDANKTERKWKNSVLTSTPKGEKILSDIEPIVARDTLKPVQIFKEKNAYIYDFGINTSGLCKLKIDASKGQIITLTYCEILKDGKFHTDNISFKNCKNKYFQQDRYICRQGLNEWTPTFTYHGFRYVKVEGVKDYQATDDLLTFYVFNTDLGHKGEFKCDNDILNTLNEMSLNSTLSNFHHFPTDCPHREKNGWTADAALSSAHTLLYFEPTANYKQWLINICKSQNEKGAIPGIVPTGGWGFAWGNGPAWDSVLIELPYQIWQKRSDISAFEICSKSILKYINYLDTRKDENGLLAIGLGDWCAPHEVLKAPLILTDSIEAFDIATKSAEMFKAVGDKESSLYCEAFAKEMRNNIRKHLLDENTLIFEGNCQTSQAMGIFYKIINEDETEKAFSGLMDMIKKEDYHIDTGVLGGRVLFHVLAENGEIDTAIRVLTNPTSPSYVQWIDNGDTALCEGFVDRSGTDSHDHHFWGNISAFFMEQICGIKVYFDAINIEPHLPQCLNNASASFESAFGKISVELTRENGKIRIDLDYPENANGYFRYNDYFNKASEVRTIYIAEN